MGRLTRLTKLLGNVLLQLGTAGYSGYFHSARRLQPLFAKFQIPVGVLTLPCTQPVQGSLVASQALSQPCLRGVEPAGPTLFLRRCSGPPSQKRCGLRLNFIKLIAIRGCNGFNEYVHIKLDWGRVRTELSFPSRIVDIAGSQCADGDSEFRGEAKLWKPRNLQVVPPALLRLPQQRHPALRNGKGTRGGIEGFALR